MGPGAQEEDSGAADVTRPVLGRVVADVLGRMHVEIVVCYVHLYVYMQMKSQPVFGWAHGEFIGFCVILQTQKRNYVPYSTYKPQVLFTLTSELSLLICKILLVFSNPSAVLCKGELLLLLCYNRWL